MGFSILKRMKISKYIVLEVKYYLNKIIIHHFSLLNEVIWYEIEKIKIDYVLNIHQINGMVSRSNRFTSLSGNTCVYFKRIKSATPNIFMSVQYESWFHRLGKDFSQIIIDKKPAESCFWMK